MELKNVEEFGRELRDSLLQILRDYSEALGVAFLIAVILRVFVVSAFRISTPSMEPSLKVGDYVLAYKLPFGISMPFSDVKVGQTPPRRWDLVVFKCPGQIDQMCVKRVVGLPGDRIEMREKRLVINDKPARYFRSTAKVSEIVRSNVPTVTLEEQYRGHRSAILVSSQEENSEFGPFVVPPGAFFALSDNRDFSEDSRHWGAVPFATIEARVFFIWLSVEWIPATDGLSSQIRWDRILQATR